MTRDRYRRELRRSLVVLSSAVDPSPHLLPGERFSRLHRYFVDEPEWRHLPGRPPYLIDDRPRSEVVGCPRDDDAVSRDLVLEQEDAPVAGDGGSRRTDWVTDLRDRPPGGHWGKHADNDVTTVRLLADTGGNTSAMTSQQLVSWRTLGETRSRWRHSRSSFAIVKTLMLVYIFYNSSMHNRGGNSIPIMMCFEQQISKIDKSKS